MARRLLTTTPERPTGAGRRGAPTRTGRTQPRSAASARPSWQTLLILCGVVGLVYANTLANGFVFDDHALILKEYGSRDPLDFRAILRDPWGNVQGRPLRTLSYDLDYSLFGFNPRYYHLANIVYHAANTLLVYSLACRLLGRARPAFVAAILFAVHPIQTEAVAYITGRKDLLATLFYLLAFLGFMRYRDLPRAGSLALTVLAFLLALLSKESAVTFPAACLLYEWIYRTKPPEGRSTVAVLRDAWQSLRDALFRHPRLYLILFGMAASSSLYALLVVKESEQRTYWGGSLGLTILTMARVFLYYVKLLILPTTLIADYSFDAFPITRSSTDPVSLLAVVGLCAIVFALLAARRRWPAVTFGGLWWFLALLPVSQLIPHHIMMAERFLYLPSVGAALVAGAVVEHALTAQRARRPVYAVVAVVAVLLSARTIIRNLDWRDDFTLLKKTAADAPRAVRARVSLGSQYQQQGLHEAAEQEYRVALDVDPGDARAHATLASLFAERGDFARAEEEYLQALRLDPDSGFRMDLARFYERRGELEKAERQYRELLARRPRDPLLHQNVAVFYHFVKRDPRRAEAEYRQALDLRPGEVEFYVGLASLYVETGQLSKAEGVLRRGLQVKPTDQRLRGLLRRVSEGSGDGGADARRTRAPLAPLPRR